MCITHSLTHHQAIVPFNAHYPTYATGGEPLNHNKPRRRHTLLTQIFTGKPGENYMVQMKFRVFAFGENYSWRLFLPKNSTWKPVKVAPVRNHKTK